jgi:hypothetical protein
VEIIRTISFVDIEGFNKGFSDILLKKKDISVTSDPKNYSLLCFKNLIDSISTLQLDKYTEVNSILASVLTDILKIPNSSFYMFGFIEQNNSSILESSITLEIMNKFKNMNVEYFFDIVSEFNIDNSGIDNKYSKDEFHIIDTIVKLYLQSLASCCTI